ncbi:MAG: arsenic resistance N-acetyltransferase ArsN2 [Fibrobacterales bacterium]
MHTIITAEHLHLSGIKALLDHAGLPTHDIADPSITFKIEKNLSGVIGYQTFTHCALLRSLAVSTKAQNRGIAKKLISETIDCLKNDGITAIYLLTTTAQPYFSRYGFRITSREKAPPEIAATAQFHSICPDSAYFMSKPL